MSLNLTEEQVAQIVSLREKRMAIDEEIGRILAAGMVTNTPPAPVAEVKEPPNSPPPGGKAVWNRETKRWEVSL